MIFSNGSYGGLGGGLSWIPWTPGYGNYWGSLSISGSNVVITGSQLSFCTNSPIDIANITGFKLNIASGTLPMSYVLQGYGGVNKSCISSTSLSDINQIVSKINVSVLTMSYTPNGSSTTYPSEWLFKVNANNLKSNTLSKFGTTKVYVNMLLCASTTGTLYINNFSTY